jgi:outer membrane protein assembly factor BamB
VSGTDGAIRALDAADGKPRWTAYTGGPLKYPPALADGRVYAGSGDGYVYCFEAPTGRLLWRFRAAPVERTIPIYGTLSSTWPVGSGVLVDSGVVYAAAGMSCFDGTHVYALDAATGKLRWQNNNSANAGSDVPDNGVSVQGHLLLHKGAIHMSAGNKPTVASYALADGTFSVTGSGRGKDLFVRNGQVRATGFPLYWRPEDDHYLSPMELEAPDGIIAVTATGLAKVKPQPDAAGKPVAEWTNNLFQEVAAVAFAKNAILVTGLNRAAKNPDQFEAELCALNPADGKLLWKQPLPAVPVAWGLAVDRTGRVIVTMMDGRVLAFATN